MLLSNKDACEWQNAAILESSDRRPWERESRPQANGRIFRAFILIDQQQDTGNDKREDPGDESVFN